MADDDRLDDSKDEGATAGGTSRRRFLARATLAIGGVIGLIAGIPLIRYLWHPVGRKTVRSSGEPIDVLALEDLPADGAPHRVQITASGVRDAWAVADNVPLGSAWLRRTGDEISCLSAVCPHLGCAIDFDGSEFKCPCHRSSFSVEGEKLSGPSKRGLDPLQVEIADGRIRVIWKRYKADVADREEV